MSGPDEVMDALSGVLIIDVAVEARHEDIKKVTLTLEHGHRVVFEATGEFCADLWLEVTNT